MKRKNIDWEKSGHIDTIYINGSEDDIMSIENVQDLLKLKQNLSTVGNGCYLDKSKYLEKIGIKVFQWGLFAERDFKKDEIITWYNGYAVKAPKKESLLSNEQLSHLRTLFSLNILLVGNYLQNGTKITNPKIQLQGLGGASYINHAKNKKDLNVKFAYITTKDYDQNFDTRAPHCNDRIVVVAAIKDIMKNTEFLTSYGEDYNFERKEDPNKPIYVFEHAC